MGRIDFSNLAHYFDRELPNSTLHIQPPDVTAAAASAVVPSNITFKSFNGRWTIHISRTFPRMRRILQVSRHLINPRSRNPFHSSPRVRFTTKMSSHITSWDRLVRYVSAKDGKIRYGEPIVSGEKPDIDQLAQDGKLEVTVLKGANPIDATSTGEKDTVKQLLGPLTPRDVPIIRCVGLNYKTHSKEAEPLA